MSDLAGLADFRRGDLLRVDNPDNGRLVMYLEPRKEGGDWISLGRETVWIERERLIPPMSADAFNAAIRAVYGISPE